MLVCAIDPGYEQSAYVLFDGARVVEHAIEANEVLAGRLASGSWRVGEITAVVLEGLESFGMPIGRETIETIFWTGRFFERAKYRTRLVERIMRRAVKVHLCYSARATDANIRMALTDRFGGTKAAAFGTKHAAGPLYGIKSHELAALAVAVTWWDQQFAKQAQTLQKGA